MSELTPTQAETLARLRPSRDGRTVWEPHVRVEFRTWLEEEFSKIVEQLEKPLWVSKHALSTIHSCQARWRAERDEDFAWSVPLARGQITHEAIRLSVHWKGDHDPEQLCRESLALLTNSDTSLGDWLQTCGDAEQAQLMSETVALTSNFFESFPPIQRAWKATTESGRKAEFCDDMIVLSGKLDLTLGGPEGTTAGRVILDIKTGAHRPEHREDLRFYALLELLRVGVAPLAVATFYVDSGRMELEEVSSNTIEAAVRRTVDGTAMMAAILAEHHEPEETPSGSCRFCCRLDTCETGKNELARDEI